MTDEKIPIDGLQVQNAYKAQDDKGYDVLVINFWNGKYLIVREEGQAGHFSWTLSDRIGR
jgi:hypothetical protein